MTARTYSEITSRADSSLSVHHVHDVHLVQDSKQIQPAPSGAKPKNQQPSEARQPIHSFTKSNGQSHISNQQSPVHPSAGSPLKEHP